MIIFLTNFLGLMIKVDAAGEDSRSAIGGLLVAVNVLLALAVISTSWLAMRQTVDDSHSEDGAFNVARAMRTAERGSSYTIRYTRERRARDSFVPF